MQHHEVILCLGPGPDWITLERNLNHLNHSGPPQRVGKNHGSEHMLRIGPPYANDIGEPGHSTSDKSKMHQSLQSSWPLFLSNLSVSNERFPFSNAAASVKYPASSFICKRGSSTTHDTLLGCTSSASDACTHMLRTLGFIVHEELLSSLLCHGWACQGQRQRTLAAAAKPCPCHLPRQQGQQWLPSTSIATLALDITSPPHLTHLCYHHSELQALQHVQLAVFPTKGLARHRRHTHPYTSSLLCNTAFLGLAQPNSQQHHMEKRPAASSASFRPAAALERCTVHSVVKRS